MKKAKKPKVVHSIRIDEQLKKLIKKHDINVEKLIAWYCKQETKPWIN